MAHQLTFERLAFYNPGKDGITIGVTLKLDGRSAVFDAKQRIKPLTVVMAFEAARRERLWL